MQVIHRNIFQFHGWGQPFQMIMGRKSGDFGCQTPVCVAFAAQRMEIQRMQGNVEKSRLDRLLDPLFIVVLLVLLLNDHVWKGQFHNFWTGKISDFAGLYAFGWMVMSVSRCETSSKTRGISWGIAMAFIVWKSPISEPLLSVWNAQGMLPLYRIVDYGDWVALVVLPLAASRYLGMHRILFWPKRMENGTNFLKITLFCLSVFAFCATSYRNDADFTDHYDLPISPATVVQRLNQLNSIQSMDALTLSLHHQNANHFQQDNDVRLYLHHNSQTETRYDTSWIEQGDSVIVDAIRQYQVPEIDTMYVNPEGVFRIDLQLLAADDTSSNACRTVPVRLKLQANGLGSRLSLLHMEWMNCDPLPKGDENEKPETYLRKRFELNVVEKLKRP